MTASMSRTLSPPPSERTALLLAESVSPPSKDEDHLSDPTKLSKRARNCVLGAMWIGVFLGALDTTIVATLVSDVSSSFEKSNQASWLGTSYLLSTATFTPLYGRLADIMGRRGAALLAVTLFTVGTALCGLAPSMLSLIIARLIAGMGGGGMMAVSSIVASDLVPLKQRALFQGVANLFFGAGSGLGGPLGGLISDYVGWRFAFLIQLPFLFLSVVLLFTFVRYKVPGQGKSKREMIQRIDYGGSLSLIVSLGSLLLGLSYKNNNNLAFSDPRVWAPLSIFAVFSIVFVLVEAFHAAEPVMPLRILKQRNGLVVSAINLLVSMVSFSVLYFFPMFFEVVLLQSASRSGAHLLPNAVALSCGSLFAGYVIRRTGRYYWLTVCTSFCPVIALVSMSFLNKDSGTFHQWFAVAPSGFGMSSVVTSVLIALIASVDRADMATSIGMSYLWRYVGQVVGVALSSSLLQSVLTSQLRARITGEGAEEIIARIRTVATSIPDLSPELQASAIASYQAGLRAVFIFNAGLALLCFLCTLPLAEFALPDTFEGEDEARRQRVGEREREE